MIRLADQVPQDLFRFLDTGFFRLPAVPLCDVNGTLVICG